MHVTYATETTKARLPDAQIADRDQTLIQYSKEQLQGQCTQPAIVSMHQVITLHSHTILYLCSETSLNTALCWALLCPRHYPSLQYCDMLHKMHNLTMQLMKRLDMPTA